MPVFEAKIRVLSMLIAAVWFLPAVVLSQQKRTYVCILTHIYTHIYNLFICSHLYLFEAKFEFILMFSPEIHYCMGRSCLLALLICISHPNNEKLASTISLNFSIPEHMYSKMLTCTPMENNFINQSRMLMLQFLYLYLINSTLFQSCLVQHLLLPLPSVRLFYTFVIPIFFFFCHSCIPSQDSHKLTNNLF